MDKFSTLSVEVTEEIKPKKLSTFFQTQITLNNCFISQKSCYYYSFIPELLRYEIIVFQDRDSALSSGVFLLSNLCQENEYTLFILEDCFCVYKGNKLLFLKQVSNTSVEDIKSYIEQTYRITASHTIFLEKKEIAELTDQCDKGCQKKTLKNINNVLSSNSLKYFIYYCITLFLLFSFIVFEKFDSNNIDTPSSKKQQYSKKLIVYKKHQQFNEIEILNRFIQYSKSDTIKIESIKYMGKDFQLRLTGSNKKSLLKLLEYPHNKLELQSIKINEESKDHILEVLLYG